MKRLLKKIWTSYKEAMKMYGESILISKTV